MRLNEYQVQALQTAIYPHHGEQQLGGVLYTALGLAGEAGEVANKVKKVIRDHAGLIHPEVRNGIVAELGGVLWYVAALATELDVTLTEVAQHNLYELKSRQQRKTLQGNGDQR